MTTLGEAIKCARERVGISQKALAELLGVAPQTVYRWEKGDREPKLDILKAISLKLNIPDLVQFIDTPEIKQTIAQSTQSITDDHNNDNDVLGFSYWGQVVDNAHKIAKNGKLDYISEVLRLLEMAIFPLLQAVKGLTSNATNQGVDSISFTGNFNNYRGNQVNITPGGDKND